MNFVFFAVLIGMTALLGYKEVLGTSWAIGVGATLVIVFLLLAVLQVISLPFAWRGTILGG